MYLFNNLFNITLRPYPLVKVAFWCHFFSWDTPDWKELMRGLRFTRWHIVCSCFLAVWPYWILRWETSLDFLGERVWNFLDWLYCLSVTFCIGLYVQSVMVKPSWNHTWRKQFDGYILFQRCIYVLLCFISIWMWFAEAAVYRDLSQTLTYWLHLKLVLNIVFKRKKIPILLLKKKILPQQFLFTYGSKACFKVLRKLISHSTGCIFSSWALDPFINLLQQCRRQQAAGLHLGTDWDQACVWPGDYGTEENSDVEKEVPENKTLAT